MRRSKLFTTVLGGVSDPYPGVTVYDPFPDVNGTLATAHTPAKAPVGASWMFDAGTMDIQSNRLSWKTNTGGLSICTINSGLSNCTVSAILQRNAAGANTSIAARVVDKDNLFVILISNNLFAIIRRLSGGASVLTSLTPTVGLNIDYVVQVVLSGNSIVATLNGANQLSVTDANFNTATKHGLYAEAAGVFDNFQVAP